MGYTTRKEIMVLGYKVILTFWGSMKERVYNAYVTIPGSKYFRGSVVGPDVTYRKGDEMGVDSTHTWLQGKSNVERREDCLKAIRRIIENCKKVLI